jgi:hypothetical protein
MIEMLILGLNEWRIETWEQDRIKDYPASEYVGEGRVMSRPVRQLLLKIAEHVRSVRDS